MNCLLKTNIMKIKLRFLLILLSTTTLFAQNPDYWSQGRISEVPQENVIDYTSSIEQATYYNLDETSIADHLKDAPQRLSGVSSSINLQVPNGNGGRDVFEMFSVQTMADALADRLTGVNSYVGRNTTDRSQKIRITITPHGFFAMVTGADDGPTFINPYARNSNVYMLFSQQNAYHDASEAFRCEVDDLTTTGKSTDNGSIPKFIEDGTLRRYRLAVGTTVEYSDFHLQEAGFSAGDTSSAGRNAVQAAIVVSIDRVNQIFERDFGITLQLVANNDQLISLGNASNDPYTNNDLGSILGENQTAIDNAIGFGNYDVGHVLGTEGGGLALTPSACSTGKAKGATGLSNPVGEYFNVSLLSHELGHQFGANHTQSSDVNENFPTAVEPGSGSTIMSYAGIAPPNIQNQADAMFHYISISEVSSTFTTSTGSCAQDITIANDAPVIQSISDHTIPKSTPFKLEADATDANSDALTYSWEQIDNDVVPNVPMPPQSTSTSGPSFRVFLPKADPFRYFPSMESLLDNNYSTTWEVLPSVARDLDLGVIVRDNNVLGGQVAHEDLTITVDDTAGPFRVTSQSTLQQPWLAYSTKSITWDVANTDDPNGVNTQEVDIWLSKDAGQNYNTLLADNTPNDGTEDIIVPDIETSNARIMVKAADNVFFDINDQSFAIGTALEPEYCDARATQVAPSTTFTNIDSVVFNTIDNGPTGHSGYSDFTNLYTPVSRGSNYTIEVSEDPGPFNDDRLLVWIDLNKDGDFEDAGEKVVDTQGNNFGGNFGTFGGSFNIPSNASLGVTRMRIRMNNPAGTSNITPCGDNTLGEVEDYNVVIYDDYLYFDNAWTPLDPENGVSTQTDNVLIIDGATTLTGTTVMNDLTLQISGELDVEGVLQVQGDIDNDGDLLFKSNTNTTGQLDSFSGTISRAVTVERFIPVATEDTRAFRFLTSAVNSIRPIYDNWQESGDSPSGFGTHITGNNNGSNGVDQTISGNPSMYTFDNQNTNGGGQDDDWQAVTDTKGNNLIAGEAYRIFIRGDRNYDLDSNPPNAPNSDVTLRATGSLEVGSHSFNLNPNQDEYSLVGNPYQAIVDMSSVTSTNIDANFYYIWDPNINGDNGRGGYVTVDIGNNTSTGTSSADKFLMPGQSVFVQTSSNGTADITFNETDKAVNEAVTTVFNDNDLFTLDLLLYHEQSYNNGGSEADALTINFQEGGNNGVDQMDADKIGNPGENLARVNGNSYLSIEYRALPVDDESLELFSDGLGAMNYIFLADLANLPTEVSPYLIDYHTGEQTLLEEGENQISFSVDPSIPESVATDRFSLDFDVETLGVDDNASLISDFEVYPNPVSDGVVTLRSQAMAGDEVRLRLYNIIGQRVLETEQAFEADGELKLEIGSPQSGVYFLEIHHQGDTTKERLIIK